MKDVAGERWVAPDAGIGDEDVQMGFPASDYGGNGEDAVFGTEIAGESGDGSDFLACHCSYEGDWDSEEQWLVVKHRRMSI